MEQPPTLMRKIRRENEIPLSTVARRSRVNVATVSQVERRERVPSADVARRLEKYFGRPMAELLSDAPV